MNKLSIGLFLLLFPILGFSQESSFTFAPPPSDYSVIFLGNIFGVVDGVLHGTGSQIMGSMFGVFNAAVLALGGLIIVYTLLVSTMNTAHEGQFLGQKWSSIWVPLRSTLGLALLIPKASGYCLMQIFVMWIVLQGVGAADKVWEGALSYLNRGGVIVKAQMNPDVSLKADTSHVADGASIILAGQVCMKGIEKVLQDKRSMYLNNKQNKSGPCAGTPPKTMKTFCDTAVPDFINTVNIVTVQNQNKTADTFKVNMPNFDPSSPYAFLNGICGEIAWNAFSEGKLENVKKNISGVSSSELETAKMSRAIAIQQMYLDLANVAQVIVNNDPTLNPQASGEAKEDKVSDVADEQFGVPYLSSGTPCTEPSDKCITWGPDPISTSAPLFNGTEFQGAVADYNGIMLPTLNLVSQAKNKDTAKKSREFIEKARSQGWILAGSYFFDLARMNASATKGGDKTDTDTGLDDSKFDPSVPTSAFGQKNQCVGPYANLCQWLDKDSSNIAQVVGLINGSTLLQSPLPQPTFKATGHQAVSGIASSTVFGFVNNSVMVSLPNQPGLSPPKFAMKFRLNIQPGPLYLKKQHFGCGKIKFFPGISKCVGRMFGDLFYNDIIRTIFNSFLDMMEQVVNNVVLTFLYVPLQGMAKIFQSGVSIIEQPGVNPVVALANMGTTYINFASELWITLIGLAIVTALIPFFGIFIFALIALAMPLLIAWLGIMVSIGFITAYYVPFLPYMIFTFGAIAWLMAVIEAMVAAPIVALGVTHPEGHEAFGKGEQAIMILLNVFLRPSMMIIGYIAAIALSYVAVWIINAGFGHAMEFIQGPPGSSSYSYDASGATNYYGDRSSGSTVSDTGGRMSGYTGWAGIYGFFFSLLMYTTMYLLVVQRSFTLITVLPDKVLRWVGGTPESVGQEAAQWGEEAKKQVEGAGAETTKASQQVDQQLSGYAGQGLEKAKGMGGGGGGVDSTPGPTE